jgi:NADH-quinone oxidoreductase subunit A
MLLTPPIVFLLLLFTGIILSCWLARLSFKVKIVPSGLNKAYTGGEEVKTSRVQPDYSQFFPFAFFFTILHVVTLVVATVPTENMGSFLIAVLYIGGTLLGLSILFRRN